MNPNPALGVFFHWLGGLASASFYVPYRGVKHWAWETYWLVGGFFSWIIAPWLLALTMTRDLSQVLQGAPNTAIFWAYFFGVLWGLGGLTFGLTMRYLGMSLGMAVALGYTAAFGTLMPPIFRGEFVSQVLGTRSGLIILGGIAICLLGIAVAGAAGVSKEREMTDEQKKAAIKEFDLKKGLLVATFSGVMSACFAYGLAAGDPIKAITVQHGTATLWQGLPVLVVVLAGGFTTNFFWCVILNIRNHTGYQYFQSDIRGEVPKRSEEHILEAVTDAPAEEMAVAVAVKSETPFRAPMLPNYLFSALAGTTWYMQFFFYTMGETQMGHFKFSSWTLHMASIIIFSTLWGIALKEWKGASGKTKLLVAISLVVLVSSTVVVGYGNYVGGAHWVSSARCGPSMFRSVNSSGVVTVEDLRRMRSGVFPKSVFDYLDGGAESEITLSENYRAFRDITFRPRGAVALSDCKLSTVVVGQELSLPFIPAPVGYSRLMHPQGEIAAAAAAGEAGTGYILSPISGHRVEDVKAATAGPCFTRKSPMSMRELLTSVILLCEIAMCRDWLEVKVVQTWSKRS